MAQATDRRRLSEVARHVVAPVGIAASEWPSVRETCRRLGWAFDGWQDGAGMLALGLLDDGEYAADTTVFSIPRQVGKTYLIGCIIFALCLMKPGLRVIWTAQVKDTALETFGKFVDLAESPRVKPHIRATPRGKGDEAVLFHNGSSIEFGARESGFGRGRTDVDVIVFDEGQHLSNNALENLGAAQNVAVNPLCFVIGTPPRPQDKGEWFTLLRQEAIDGESDGTLYIEFSADPGSDPMDREQWRKANPSFPIRTSERAMLRLRKKLKNPDSWRREALGIWDEDARTSVVPGWPKRFTRDTPPDPTAIGLAVSLDLQWGSIGAAGVRKDGLVHADAVERRPGSSWLVAEAKRIQDDYRCAVVIDEKCPDASLITDLRDAGVNLTVLKLNDVIEACSWFPKAVKEDRVCHGNTTELNDAIGHAAWRMVWDRKLYGRKQSTGDISMLEAVTLAAWRSSDAYDLLLSVY